MLKYQSLATLSSQSINWVIQLQRSYSSSLICFYLFIPRGKLLNSWARIRQCSRYRGRLRSPFARNFRNLNSRAYLSVVKYIETIFSGIVYIIFVFYLSICLHSVFKTLDLSDQWWELDGCFSAKLRLKSFLILSVLQRKPKEHHCCICSCFAFKITTAKQTQTSVFLTCLCETCLQQDNEKLM